jgi:hypothetical protein
LHLALHDHSVQKTRQFLLEYYPVLLALLIQQLLLWLATLGQQYSILHAGDFARGDSNLYFDIARKGYEAFPCTDIWPDYPMPEHWCGNAGWMPLLPWLLKPFIAMGIQDIVAAYWLSRLCYAAVLCLVFSMCRSFSKTSRLLTLILAGIFPSAIYFTAAFPISLMLVLLLGSWYFWKRKSYLVACACAFLVPLAYSTGFVSLFPWTIFLLFLYKKDRALFRRTIFIPVSILSGYAVFFIIQKISTGYWDAFFLVQGKYEHGFHDISIPVWRMIRSIGLSGLNHNWQNVQSLVFIVFLFVVSLRSVHEKDQDVLFANLCFIGFAVFPLLIGSDMLAQYRSQALLLPLVLFIGQNKKLTLVLIPVYIYLSLNCAIDFFTLQIN